MKFHFLVKYSKQNTCSSSVLNCSQTAIFYVVQKPLFIVLIRLQPSFLISTIPLPPKPMCTIRVHRINIFQDILLSHFPYFYLALHQPMKGSPIFISEVKKNGPVHFIKNSKRFPHHTVLLSVYTLKHVAGNYE